jgi:hypothetical protein
MARGWDRGNARENRKEARMWIAIVGAALSAMTAGAMAFGKFLKIGTDEHEPWTGN